MMTKLKTTVLMSIVLFMASCSSNKVLGNDIHVVPVN